MTRGIEQQRVGGEPWVRAFFRFAGRRPGGRRGPATRAGREGWVEVAAWGYALGATPGGGPGAPRPVPLREPLVLTKPIDEISGRLMAAMIDGQVLAAFALEHWRIRRPRGRRLPQVEDLLDRPADEAVEVYLGRLRRDAARQELDYAIELRSVHVVRIETELADVGEPGDGRAGPFELVSLAWHQLVWQRGDERIVIDAAAP